MFLVNLEQTSSCKFVTFGKNLLVLIYSKLKDKTQCQNKVSYFSKYQYSHIIKLNQQSIYQTHFHEPFPAHDAMEDVETLRRIVFDSCLNISEDMLI